MTISNTDTDNKTTGDGAETEFAFTFDIFDTSEVKVYLITTATGVPVLQTETTHYSVSATNNNYRTGPGGTVTMVTAPTALEKLYIVHQPPLTQANDMNAQSTMRNVSTTTTEQSLDKLTTQVQWLQKQVDTCIKIPVSEVGLTVELPNAIDRASEDLIMDASGNVTTGSGSSGGVTHSAIGTALATASSELVAREAIGADTMFNVRDAAYGAVGDGATDDESEIELAITAAAVNGGTVFFPVTGSAYAIDDAITVPSNVTLQFAPGASLMGLTGDETLFVENIADTMHQIFQSTITVSGVRRAIKPEWFGTNTTPGTTDMTTAIQAAIDCAEVDGGTVFLSFGEYLVTATLTVGAGISIIGANEGIPRSNQFSTAWVTRITHDPAIANTHLFEEVTDAQTYVTSITIKNLAMVGQTDGTAGDMIHFDKPGWCLFENLFILNCETGISISQGIANKIVNCFIQSEVSNMQYGFEVRGDNGVTTTTILDGVYFVGFTWSAKLEKTLKASFINCIFESSSAGGVDIDEPCETTTFTDCYSEDVPTTAIAAPIIQVGVNGASATGFTGDVSVHGGVYAGFNGSPHASSTFINADYSSLITVSGVTVKRIGVFMATTANSLQQKVSGIQGPTVTSWTSGINDFVNYQGSQGGPGTDDTEIEHFNVIQLNGGSGAYWRVQQTSGTMRWINATNEFLNIQSDGTIHQMTDPSHGGYLKRIYSASSGALTGATDTIDLAIPSGWRILQVQLHVKTAVVTAGDNTWSAELNDGGTEEAIVSGAAAAQNINVNHWGTAETWGTLTDAETDILLTPNGGSFTSGEIEAHAICIGFDAWTNE